MSTTPTFDLKLVEEMNRKAIENQFFTPDHVYIDLSLFKDFPIGIVYADKIYHRAEEASFHQCQQVITDQLSDYQQRLYDTVEPFFGAIGYDDDKLERLTHILPHDLIFMMAPATHFLQAIARATIRNQNNSAPANKFTKKKLDREHYVLEAMPVTYYLNTYPLTLSLKLQERLAPELGEALGVNIQFLRRDPQYFDQHDWDQWMNKIDCFYLNSLGRMTRSPFILQQQGNLHFAGVWFFARKRFEKQVMHDMRQLDVEHQIQLVTAQLDMLCDFAWLPNNDVRLTDASTISEEDLPPHDQGIPSS